MKKIEYKLLHKITQEIVENRFLAFNESLNYYRNIEASWERYDEDSSHLAFFIEGKFAGYTRLTECPKNYMSIENLSSVGISNDKDTIEMGRTFVLPTYRAMNLLNVILGIGLNICRQIGFKKVVGNVSYENHIKMPASLGFEFTNIVADFKMPFSDKGKHSFYLLECDLEMTNSLRQLELEKQQKRLREKGFDFCIY